MADILTKVWMMAKNWFIKFIKFNDIITNFSPSSLAVPPAWTFVDSIQVVNTGHLHIRQLTNKGRQMKGGIDTTILCGLDDRRQIFYDVSIPFTEGNIILGCHRCVAVYRNQTVFHGPY